MEPQNYFFKPQTIAQKQYCALAAYFKDKISAKEAAEKYGYTLTSFYSLIKAFKEHLKKKPEEEMFFRQKQRGRKKRPNAKYLEELSITLRNKNLSVNQITNTLRKDGHKITYSEVWDILKRNGFTKMTRRTTKEISRSNRFLK